jgi:rhodanese-related sulfurtransferase
VDSPVTEPKRRAVAGKVLGEALLVAIVGAALAFAANALSPRGLKLSQDYFLTGADHFATNRPVAVTATNRAANRLAETNFVTDAPTLISVPRLDDKALQAIDSAQALRFYHDARRESGSLVFVDARDEEKYLRGHIPGAYELDPYHPEQYLPSALPACQSAEVIVVYCTSGDCEDSEIGALLLRNAGIPNEKLFVYVGGINEWTEKKLPLETGARLSGTITNADK